MADVFDLDAVAAESEAEPFPFKFGGDVYELPAHIDLRASVAWAEGHILDAFTLLLGEDQWQQIQDSDAVLDDNQFLALMDAYQKHLGLRAGESKASSRSSRSTARPSKRTSQGTTKLR